MAREIPKRINVWNAVYNLNSDLGVEWKDLATSLMGWIGDYEVREWLQGRVERDYELTFDEDGNIISDEDDE